MGFFHLLCHLLYLLIYFVYFHLLYLFFFFAFCFITLSLSEWKWLDVLLFYLFELFLLDLASIFLSIPPSPSLLMNDSDVFLPETAGNMCGPVLGQNLKHSSTTVLHGIYLIFVQMHGFYSFFSYSFLILVLLKRGYSLVSDLCAISVRIWHQNYASMEFACILSSLWDAKQEKS